ncbi:MAG: 23S rRNA (pseudouridine(1915)-N(3))-methyltransferase RlmH [Flavobacteriaceae bacterium]
MKLKILAIGKTDSSALSELISEYEKRLKRFVPLELEIIPDVKKSGKLSATEQMRKEAEALLNRVKPGDKIVLLDERGRQYSSLDFAKYLQQQMNSGIKQLVFVIGGPYGADQQLRQRAMDSWSLSKLTFSHQMVRLFAIEQIYRAMTILKNQPYHHR